jgi:hypothetical protein
LYLFFAFVVAVVGEDFSGFVVVPVVFARATAVAAAV